jgi:reductive dehalogenase
MLEYLFIVGWTIVAAVIVLFILTLWALILEKEFKGFPVFITAGTMFIVSFIILLSADYPGKLYALAFVETFVLGVGILFIRPNGKVTQLIIPADTPLNDERDIMFARAGYIKGSPSYLNYYSLHPERQAGDDFVRSLPGICSPGSAMFDPFHASIAIAAFRFLGDIRPLAEGSPSPEKKISDPAFSTKMVKGLAEYYGAKICGITETKPYHYYSHRGRHPENYADEVTNIHKYAIVFAVEMESEMVKGAPQMQVVLESAKQYVEGAKIGMVLSYFIRELGYDARNHMDGNYLVCAPLVAHDAGIGEISRMGIIITQNFGPRVRLGVVTTDLPLIPDSPKPFGVQDTCQSCEKCAKNCPSQAIPYNDKAPHNGVLKWKINQEKCYEFWCRVGTDCAVCMKVCPYSKPHSVFHTIFRCWLSQSALLRKIMVHLDDFMYGSKPSVRNKPHWM